MVTSSKRAYASMRCLPGLLQLMSLTLRVDQPMTSLETPGHSHASLVSFFWGHCSFLLGPRHKVLLCPPRVYLPVLCKFWQLYGGVSDDLLQEDLCHTQVCCTQSSCPCGRAILIRTSTGDAQTQFCLSLCGVPGSCCAQICMQFRKQQLELDMEQQTASK